MPAIIMLKLRKQRFFYRSGRVQAEIREKGGLSHGLNRTWHFNGQLAEELRFLHGQLHGLCRSWDDHGRLLGSFTMNHGTGTQLYWHQNGKLKLEINSFKGKFFGRTRCWLRDGTLVQETYYLSNVEVTRFLYLKAARQHPDWPQPDGKPSGRVAREGPALKLKEHELFIESLLERNHAEARHWLSVAKNLRLRSLARFRTATAALRFVETLYAAGAETVIAALVCTGKGERQFADRLLVKLPKASPKRKTLRAICRDLCTQRGGAWLPDDKDLGESHLFINLE